MADGTFGLAFPLIYRFVTYRIDIYQLDSAIAPSVPAPVSRHDRVNELKELVFRSRGRNPSRGP
jgi:hypothetical protein